MVVPLLEIRKDRTFDLFPTQNAITLLSVSTGLSEIEVHKKFEPAQRGRQAGPSRSGAHDTMDAAQDVPCGHLATVGPRHSDDADVVHV